MSNRTAKLFQKMQRASFAAWIQLLVSGVASDPELMLRLLLAGEQISAMVVTGCRIRH
jgi:hypothetical protein